MLTLSQSNPAILRATKTSLVAVQQFGLCSRYDGRIPKLSMNNFPHPGGRISPLDIIITCSICQESISSIYFAPEDIDGLRQAQGPGNTKITKLWLTECAHLTCTKHLPGGGKQHTPALGLQRLC